jgi:hypothetical protein
MLYFAMAGLVTAIHVYKTLSASTTWRAEATPPSDGYARA